MHRLLTGLTVIVPVSINDGQFGGNGSIASFNRSHNNKNTFVCEVEGGDVYGVCICVCLSVCVCV